MKAIVQDRYGPLEALQLVDVDTPAVGEHDVRIRVVAASVNRGDVHLVRGTPYALRFMGYGVRRPKQRIVGRDAAGVVEEVGPSVKQWRAGDEVFGWC